MPSGSARSLTGSGFTSPFNLSIGPSKHSGSFFSDPLDSHPLGSSRRCLSSLNHDLIDLINRDYADFVNLSTKLVHIDSAIVRMSALVEFRDKIEQFQGSVQALLVALTNGFNQRSEAAKAREVLELVLDTVHVVSKLMPLLI